MSNLSELKEVFVQKAESIKKKVDFTKGVFRGTEIKTKANQNLSFSIEVNMNRKRYRDSITTKARPMLEIRKHAVVEIEFENNFLRLGKDEKKTDDVIQEAFVLMVEYWQAYSELKDLEGVIFVVSSDSFGDAFSIGELLKKYQLPNKKEYEKTLNLYFNKVESTTKRVKTFAMFASPLLINELETLCGLSEMFKRIKLEEPLLDISTLHDCLNILGNGIDDEGFFEEPLQVSYHGKNMEFSYSNDYQKIKVRPDSNGSLGYSIIDNEEAAIIELLREVKDEMKLLNIVKPTVQHFTKLANSVLDIRQEETMNFLFSTLEAKFIEWEEVEFFSNYIQTKYTEQEFFEMSSITSTQPNTFTGFRILRFLYKGEFVFFISYKEKKNYQLEDKGHILFSVDKNPQELKELVIGIVFPFL